MAAPSAVTEVAVPTQAVDKGALAPQVEEGEAESRKPGWDLPAGGKPNSATHHRLHAQFSRQCKSGVMPAVFVAKLKEPKGKQELFEEWFASQGDWKTVIMSHPEAASRPRLVGVQNKSRRDEHVSPGRRFCQQAPP